MKVKFDYKYFISKFTRFLELGKNKKRLIFISLLQQSNFAFPNSIEQQLYKPAL